MTRREKGITLIPLPQYRRPGRFTRASFPAHILFHPWSWLCLLATLLCGIAVVTADDTRFSALTVSVNSSVTGAISEPGDVDYWRIDVPSAGQLEVETTGATDTVGVIEDSEGNKLAEHDDQRVPTNLNFKIELTVTVGTYYVRVSAYEDKTGDYTLHVRDASAEDDSGGGETGNEDTQDSDINLVSFLGDLNGDGHDDVLLRHTDGRWHYYPMNGRAFLDDGQGEANLTRNPDWQFAGIGDLNGDGKDDVLVRRVTDGRWYYYPMDGRRHLIDQRGGTSIVSDPAWQFAGTGDLNGDGKDDVLLRHRDDGRWLYYPMDGRTHIPGGRGLANIPRDRNLQFAGIGDLNGDGRDDVLLRHTNGTWQYFPMDGRDYLRSERGAAFLTSNRDWQFAGIGDLNGDGKDDVLVRHVETGRWYYYPMDGRRHLVDQRGGASIVSDPAWQLAGIGDLNGDGKDDVLLRHRDDGRWLYYPMDGLQHITDEHGTADLTVDLDWMITGTVLFRSVAAGDGNGDGMEDEEGSNVGESGGLPYVYGVIVRKEHREGEPCGRFPAVMAVDPEHPSFAERKAFDACHDLLGEDSRCVRVAAWTNRCGAFADSPSCARHGSTWGKTRAEAEERALRQCRVYNPDGSINKDDCLVRMTHCPGDDEDTFIYSPVN